jgi:hypothetical protein
MNYANLEEAFAFYNSSNFDEELETIPVVLNEENPQEITSISKETTGIARPASVCNCCSDKSPYDISNMIIILLLIIIFFKK